MDFDGAGNTDFINITGEAMLNGGQVLANSVDGIIISNTPYTILTAQGGVNGSFDSVVMNNPLLTGSLSYDLNNVYLTVIRHNPPPPPPNPSFHFDAVTPNQIAVARELEGITDPTSGELLILEALSMLTPTEQQKALNQMSGEQYASLSQASEISGKQFIRRLYDPLRSIVTTNPCSLCENIFSLPVFEGSCEGCLFPITNGYCEQSPIPIYNGYSYAYPNLTLSDFYDPCQAPTFDAWFEVSGGQSFLNGNNNARGFTLNGYEVTTGFQSTFCRNWTLGFAGSYAEDHIQYYIGNNGKNRMGFGAIYGLYRPSNFYILTDLAFGMGQFTVNRSIDIGDLSYSAKSRPNHYQGLGYIEAGVDWSADCLLVQPFLGFEGGYFKRNSVSETGTSPLNLNIHQQIYGNVHSRLGVHMTTKRWENFKLSLDTAWNYRLTSTKRSIVENFHDFGGDFKITGIPESRSSVDVALTSIIKLLCGWELYLESSGEFWSSIATYNVLGGVNYSW